MATFSQIRLPRGFLLIHPIVGFVSIPAALLWLERVLRLPRLPGRFWPVAGVPAAVFGWTISSWSARLFVTRGQGTPDPNKPPQVLVQEGPYRYSRNPMVVGAVLGLAGTGMLSRSFLLLLYVAAFAPVLHFYQVRTEEPELVRRFGQAYVEYQRRVPRWLPRVPRPGRADACPYE